MGASTEILQATQVTLNFQLPGGAKARRDAETAQRGSLRGSILGFLQPNLFQALPRLPPTQAWPSFDRRRRIPWRPMRQASISTPRPLLSRSLQLFVWGQCPILDKCSAAPLWLWCFVVVVDCAGDASLALNRPFAAWANASIISVFHCLLSFSTTFGIEDRPSISDCPWVWEPVLMQKGLYLVFRRDFNTFNKNCCKQYACSILAQPFPFCPQHPSPL